MTQLFLIVAPMLLIASLAGYGAAFCAVFARISPWDFFESAFAGIFVVTAGVLIINFFAGLGVNPGPWVLAVGLILLGICHARGGLDISPLALLVAFAASLVFQLRSNAQLPVDAGLYYLSAMNWAAYQPAPLGLANLEGRLGFDSAWLLFESAFRWEHFWAWSHLVVAEIALRSLVIGWIAQAFQAESAKGRSEKAWLHFVSLALLSIYVFVRMPAPATTDLPANLTAFCAWMVFCRLMLADEADEQDDRQFALMCLLIVLAIAFKVAMAPIALLPLLLLAKLQWRDLGGMMRASRGVLWSAASFAILWLIRNFVLTGCLVFPADATCFAVPWGVASAASAMAAVVRGWARHPVTGAMDYAGLLDMRWIPHWLGDFRTTAEFYFVLAALGVALVFKLFPAGRARDFPGMPQWARTSLSCAICGILLWFFTAPNPRFAWVFFLIISITSIFVTTRQFADRVGRLGQVSWSARRALMSALVLGLAVTAIQVGRGRGRIEAPVTPFKTVFVAARNWQVLMPVSGDQCWDLFPCTPYGLGDKTVRDWNGRLLFQLSLAHRLR